MWAALLLTYKVICQKSSSVCSDFSLLWSYLDDNTEDDVTEEEIYDDKLISSLVTAPYQSTFMLGPNRGADACYFSSLS